MNFQTREEIAHELKRELQTLLSTYQLDDIGIFEEQGAHNQYYMGYTVKKDGKTYMIHKPFLKNEQGLLTKTNEDWTMETDEPNHPDVIGYRNLKDAFQGLH